MPSAGFLFASQPIVGLWVDWHPLQGTLALPKRKDPAGVSYRGGRPRCKEVMKIAGRENLDSWANVSSSRALGAGGSKLILRHSAPTFEEIIASMKKINDSVNKG